MTDILLSLIILTSGENHYAGQLAAESPAELPRTDDRLQLSAHLAPPAAQNTPGQSAPVYEVVRVEWEDCSVPDGAGHWRRLVPSAVLIRALPHDPAGER